jgi:nitrogen fixation/metabolism regulation signal transduction histidine kinase
MSARQRLTRTIAIRAVISVLLIALVAALFRQYWLSVAIATGGVILTLGVIHAPLARLRKHLGALADGVRGFADGDFSLRLHVTGDDEITDLISIYNQIGNVLREQRSESLQRELLFETVLQASPLAIVLTNQQRRIVFVNRAARDLFARGDRMEGHLIDDVVASTFLSAGLFTVESETYQVTRRTFFLNTREHVLWMIARLTQELRHQEIEVWKRAIRVVNHELNNSLAPVHSLFHSARVVRSRGGDDTRLDEINGAIEERLQSLQQFIDGYAEFARLPKPRRAPVSWRDLLESVRRVTPFTIADPLPDCAAVVDRAQFERVIINLVKNAKEAGSADDDICVRVTRRANGASLVVEDRGRGMDDAAIAHAMLPFYSTRSGGTGLGLPLVNDIIDAHGGSVRISRRAGGGTAVTCWLPDVNP